MYAAPAYGYAAPPAGYAYPAAYGAAPAPAGYPAAAPAGYPAPAAGYPAPVPGYPAPAAGAYPGTFPGPPAGYPPGQPAYAAYGGSFPSACPPPGYPGYPGYPPAAQPGHGHSGRDGREREGRGGRDRDRDRARERASSPAPARAALTDAPAEAKPAGPPEGLTVTGCTHGTVGNIVRGEFNLSSDNHGKPVYKKTAQVNGLDVMLYFWDERDGDKFCGWWFGPKVGGDQVWAYHPEKAAVPPTTGWKVPYDGPVDSTFAIAHKPAAPAPAEKEKAADNNDSRRRGEEDRKRSEADKKRQAEQLKKKQEEEAKQKLEEEKKRKEDEQKRLEEEMKRKLEDEIRQRDDEARKKKEMEEKRRQEQKSALAIRRVIQKVRAATPENFDELNKELQEVLAAELENTGSQKQRMTEESDKGLEQARARIEQINLARQKEQEKKDEEERKRREVEDKAKRLVQELTELVDAAEEGANELRETALPFEGNSDLSVADVEQTAKAVEQAGHEAKARTKACTDFILQRGPEMKDPGPTLPGEVSETKQALVRLLQRINECTRAAETAVATARGKKNHAVRRAAARERTKEMEALFTKYDKDGDGFMSKKEVVEYARAEYRFAVPEEALSRIWRNMVEDGERGIPRSRFQWLRVAIGAARERERDNKRRKEREEKESVLTDMKSDLHERVREAAKAVDDADKDVSRAEKQVQPLQAKAKTMPAPAMVTLADETDEIIKEAKTSVTEARRQIDSLSEGLDERFQRDLRAFLGTEAKQLEMRMGRMDSRLSRATNLCSRFREQATKKRTAELEKLRAAVVKVIRYNQRTQQLDKQQLFAAFDKNGDGEIDEDEFVAFLESADKEIRDLDNGSNHAAEASPLPSPEDGPPKSPAEGEAPPKAGKPPLVEVVQLPTDAILRVFPTWLDEGSTTMSKETFLRIVRQYFKVIKETALTDNITIKDSKTIRRLDVNEVVEVLEGPVREENADVNRVRAKAMRDNLEGWVTIAGNQGTLFLKEGAPLFKVVKETILTESFGLLADKEATRKLKDTTRKLKEGEVLEVYEWPRREETSGLTRMKAKVKGDGAVGWVTTTGNQGAVFAELL